MSGVPVIARQVLVLFGGGHDAGYANFNDTWEWQNNAWVRRTDLPISPPDRWAFMMAYDAHCQRVILFGGLYGMIAEYNDTWVYDGQSWNDVKTSLKPPGRWDGGMIFDSAKKQIVLFGGQYHEDEFRFLNDTWFFTGNCE